MASQIEGRIGNRQTEPVEDLNQPHSEPRKSGHPPPASCTKLRERLPAENRHQQDNTGRHPPPDIGLKYLESDELVFTEKQGKEQAPAAGQEREVQNPKIFGPTGLLEHAQQRPSGENHQTRTGHQGKTEDGRPLLAIESEVPEGRFGQSEEERRNCVDESPPGQG